MLFDACMRVRWSTCIFGCWYEPERGRREVRRVNPDELDNLVADQNARNVGSAAGLYGIHPANQRNVIGTTGCRVPMGESEAGMGCGWDELTPCGKKGTRGLGFGVLDCAP